MDRVKIICIRNPFDPVLSREVKECDVSPGMTARGCVADLFPSPTPGLDLVVSINGRVLEDGDDPVLSAGDTVVFCATPRGGDGKNILRIVAMIAVMVVAPQVGPWIAGMTGGSLVTFAGMSVGATLSMYTAGAMLVGGMLVNALFPSKTPNFEGLNKAFEKSQTYGWEAGGNIASPGSALPALYGRHRIVPPKIGQYVSTRGDKQYLNMLFAIAGHEIDSVESVRINAQPIEYYRDIEEDVDEETVETFYTLGTNDPDDIPWFGDSRIDVSVGAKVSTSWVTRQTNRAVDKLGIALVAPSGLWYAQNDGTLGGYSVEIEIQYREYTEGGTEDWIDWVAPTKIREVYSWFKSGDYTISFPWSTPIRIRTARYQAGTQVDFVTPTGTTTTTVVSNDPEIEFADIVPSDATDLYVYKDNTLSGSSSGTLRWYFENENPGAGLTTYEYRVRFASEPESSTRYGSEVWLDFQQEIVCESFNYPNTAVLVVRALATDKLSGGAPRVDLIAERSTVPVWTGAAYEDKPATSPAWASWHMLHDDLNGGDVAASRIVFDDFEDWADWCTTKDFTCNIYFDNAMEFKQALDTVGILGRGQVVQMGSKFTCLVEKPNTATQRFMFGMGNTETDSFTEEWLSNTERADEIEVTYWDADNEYERTTITLQQEGFDAATSVPNTQTVTLYGCTDRQMAGRYGRFLLNKNKHLTLTAGWNADIDSLGCLVGDVVDVSHDLPQWGYSGRVVAATSDTVTLDREVSLSSGKTYVIDVKHADDTRETQTITAETSTTTDTLTLDSAWETIPEKFDIYAFGEVDQATRPFLVLGINRDGDNKASILGLEYVPEVFEDAAYIPIPEASQLGEINGFTAKEIWTIHPDGSGRSVIDLSWHTEVDFFWNIYLRPYDPDSPKKWQFVGTSTNTTYRINEALSKGKTYQVAVSTSGPDGGESATVTIEGKTYPPSDVTGLTAETRQNGIRISWNKVPDIDFREYILRVGDSFEGGTTIYQGRSDNYLWEVREAAAYDFWIVAVDSLGQESDSPAYYQHFVEIPSVTDIEHEFVESQLVLSWTAADGDYPIAEYVISHGSEYETSATIARVKTTSWSVTVSWSGSRIFWITPVDTAGNEGTQSSTEAMVVTPSAVQNLNPQTIHNNVLLRWEAPATHTLPVTSYLLKEGETEAGAELLGEISATFATNQELTADTYTYWIAAVDSAGNTGAWSSIKVSVNAPAGFVLRSDSFLDLTDADDESGTVIVEHTGSILIPIVNTETWEDHFVDNSWDDPDGQITAGYTYYMQPAGGSGYWEQEIDMGTMLDSSQLTVVPDIDTVDGSPDWTIDISTSEDGIDWTTYEDVLAAFSSAFRYVKIKLNVTSDVSNVGLLRVNSLRLIVSVTEKTDSGQVAVSSNPTSVTFSTEFMDVYSITATADGEVPLIAIVDFTDEPSPTGFDVYLYDNTGNPATGTVKWMATGV